MKNFILKYHKKAIIIAFILLISLSLSACNSNSIPNEANNLMSKSDNLEQNNLNLNNSSNLNLYNMRTLPEQADLALEFSQAILKTNLGDITVKFYAEDSPITVNNFLNLAQDGFYNKTKFHRIIKNFMIQGGDPNSKGDDLNTYGIGGPNYRFGDEINNHPLIMGSLAMANAGPDTNGSQFFIVNTDSTPWLDGKHTNFGEVVAGLDVLKKISEVVTGPNDIPVEPVILESIELLK